MHLRLGNFEAENALVGLLTRKDILRRVAVVTTAALRVCSCVIHEETEVRVVLLSRCLTYDVVVLDRERGVFI